MTQRISFGIGPQRCGHPRQVLWSDELQVDLECATCFVKRAHQFARLVPLPVELDPADPIKAGDPGRDAVALEAQEWRDNRHGRDLAMYVWSWHRIQWPDCEWCHWPVDSIWCDIDPAREERIYTFRCHGMTNRRHTTRLAEKAAIAGVGFSRLFV